MLLLAKGYLQTDRPNEAIDLLEKTEKLRPDDMAIREQLYALYEKKGDTKNALSEMKQIVDRKHDSKYMLKYAEACMQTEYMPTRKHHQDIRATEPENLAALMLQERSRACRKMGRCARDLQGSSYINPITLRAFNERAEIHLMQSKIQWARPSTNGPQGRSEIRYGRNRLAKVARRKEQNRLYDPY